MTAKRSTESKTFLPSKIVSGGQTGVDRAGLEVAIALDIDHGGWCPAGRLAEDGSVPSRYRLIEMPTSDYPARTEQNVIDSDATLILYETKLKGGTLLTRRICQRQSKPFLLVKIGRDEPSVVKKWLHDLQPATLNIAGPRESSSPGIRQRCIDFLHRVF